MGFIWTVRSGQYEDTTTPSLRPLLNDNKPESTFENSQSQQD